ncbi:LacI family DNA-binding transcriptional regulator, partial [Clostridium neonatale]
MKVTIQDVAKKANVSVATVSRVMNGNYPVKAETRESVLKAVDELNYIPNMQARELTQKKSTTIGVVVPSINNMFFPEVINGIENHL